MCNNNNGVDMIRLHPAQSTVYREMFINNLVRFMVCVCSRGWGKSYLGGVAAKTAVSELTKLHRDVPNKNVYIICPTFDQASEIYFPILAYELGLAMYAVKFSQDRGYFKFKNNVMLRLISYESIERLRGKGAYFVLWDEVASCIKGPNPMLAWQTIIQPTIVTRWSWERAKSFGAKSPGRCMMIGTPKGYDDFYDFFNKQELDELWKSFNFDYKTSPYLDPEEIERLKHEYDPLEFAREFLASFNESGNNVFYMFDRLANVRDDLPDFLSPQGDALGEDIHAFIDFNVGIQATSMGAIRGKEVHVINELQGHPDTETLAKTLRNTYKNHKIFAYPDPSGKSAKTSAPVGRTDLSILESYGIIVLSRNKAPAIADSVNAVNRKLKNAAGKSSLYFHPRCKQTIKSMERTVWAGNNPNSATIDKKLGVEHFSDGIRYGMEYLYPVHNVGKRVSRGFSF